MIPRSSWARDNERIMLSLIKGFKFHFLLVLVPFFVDDTFLFDYVLCFLPLPFKIPEGFFSLSLISLAFNFRVEHTNTFFRFVVLARETLFLR